MNIITGLQPTGDLHIGNYFGAIVPPAKRSNEELNDSDTLFMMVADLHGLTGNIEYDMYQRQIIDNLKVYIASGYAINKPNVNVFRQSTISAHSELAWLLACFTGFGEMGRMTQFKDKSAQNTNNINVGLFSYPILMAADILLYDAMYVPVGEDQRQHIELTRNLAIKINNRFGEIFVIPQSYDNQNKYFKQSRPLRIKSLTDPTKKMSKSSIDLKSKILLSDNQSEITKKIMSSTTDTLGIINLDYENQAGISNLLEILALVRSQNVEDIASEFAGNTKYGEFKKIVALELSNFILEIQNKVQNITDEDVLQYLKKGENNARELANQTLIRFQKVLGLR